MSGKNGKTHAAACTEAILVAHRVHRKLLWRERLGNVVWPVTFVAMFSWIVLGEVIRRLRRRR